MMMTRSDGLGSAFGDHGKPQGGGPSWRVVWCCERSHKAEEESQRQAIENCAQHLGGGLTCFKKSKTFTSWLDRRWEQHVLLTDGREIKPCMQALSEVPLSRWPSLIVVLQPNPVHAARTLAWAASSATKGSPVDVNVVADVGEFSALLQQQPCLRGRTIGLGTEQSPIAATQPSMPFFPRMTGDASRRGGTGAAMPLCIPPQVLRPAPVLLSVTPTFFVADVEAVSKMLADAQPEVYEE
mmetsp:Transcript_11751/g.33826  ORF Transcript_11751/g.33826 Transcript_11751/m.33826 type:complete len:240 (+) Transcript_11751:61-780(+)